MRMPFESSLPCPHTNASTVGTPLDARTFNFPSSPCYLDIEPKEIYLHVPFPGAVKRTCSRY